MKLSTLADLLGVHVDTIRRWTSRDYRQFMSPTASPGKGQQRRFTQHDLAVLTYIATCRDENIPPDEVRSRLVKMQADGWADLPAIPPEWTTIEEQIPVAMAASRASEIAEIAVLRTELEHTRAALQEAVHRAESAESTVAAIQDEMEALRAAGEASTAEMRDQLHAAQLDLERARQDVAMMQGQLSQYAIFTDKPMGIGLLLVLALVFALMLLFFMLGFMLLTG